MPVRVLRHNRDGVRAAEGQRLHGDGLQDGLVDLVDFFVSFRFVVDAVDENVDVGAFVGEVVEVVATGDVVFGVRFGDGLEAGEDGAACEEDVVPVEVAELELGEDVEVAFEFVFAYYRGLVGGFLIFVEREHTREIIAIGIDSVEDVLVLVDVNEKEVGVVKEGVGPILGVQLPVVVLFINDLIEKSLLV